MVECTPQGNSFWFGHSHHLVNFIWMWNCKFIDTINTSFYFIYIESYALSLEEVSQFKRPMGGGQCFPQTSLELIIIMCSEWLLKFQFQKVTLTWMATFLDTVALKFLLNKSSWFMIFLCRFCTLMARVMWFILNLETLESLALTDTDSSLRSTCHTLHGQVSIVYTCLIFLLQMWGSLEHQGQSQTFWFTCPGDQQTHQPKIYFFQCFFFLFCFFCHISWTIGNSHFTRVFQYKVIT